MLLSRLREGIAWRARGYQRRRYLRKAFANGDALLQSYLNRTACDEAIFHDGTLIRHPSGRLGLAQLLLEIWFERVYSERYPAPAAGDVIINAGANIGVFSIQMGKLQPNCRILAFEPFRENFKLLEQNLGSAAVHCVEPHHVALSSASGFATMVAIGERSQDHRLSVAKGASAEVRKDAGDYVVPTLSLANIWEMTQDDEIAMFKCDIEGSEADLFGTAQPTELIRVRQFAIEWHDHLRPGVRQMLIARLQSTHEVEIVDESGGKWGMLYARRR